MKPDFIELAINNLEPTVDFYLLAIASSYAELNELSMLPALPYGIWRNRDYEVSYENAFREWNNLEIGIDTVQEQFGIVINQKKLIERWKHQQQSKVDTLQESLGKDECRGTMDMTHFRRELLLERMRYHSFATLDEFLTVLRQDIDRTYANYD